MQARITGATAGYIFRTQASSEGSVGIVNLGQIYFPPLAWQLAPPPESRLKLGAPQSLLDDPAVDRRVSPPGQRTGLPAGRAEPDRP